MAFFVFRSKKYFAVLKQVFISASHEMLVSKVFLSLSVCIQQASEAFDTLVHFHPFPRIEVMDAILFLNILSQSEYYFCIYNHFFIFDNLFSRNMLRNEMF